MTINNFNDILQLFGTQEAKNNFLNLCSNYYGERVKQEVAEQTGEVAFNSKRAEIHNQIMEIIGKLAIISKDPMPSRKEVGLMIMDYCRMTKNEE